MNESEGPKHSPPAGGSAVRQEVKREIVEFAKMVAWFLVLFFILRSYVIEGYEVQGPSMIPTLHDRERILVFKLPHELSQFRLFGFQPFGGLEALHAGDVVVFQSLDDPGKRYVKRVIAKGPHSEGGNTVDARQQENGSPEGEEAVPVRIARGRVYVNNKRVREEYLNPDETPSEETFREVRVKPGYYYVMGDNRSVSKDSRVFGPIDDGYVVGKAVLRFWPLSKFGLVR